MRKIKFILFVVFIAPVIIISMWIHESYKLWYKKRLLKEISFSAEKGNQKRNNCKANGDQADAKSK